MTNYNKQIYKQLEEVISKLDKSLAENRKQTIIINNLKDEIKAYQQQHENDQLKIELLIQEIEKLKNKNNKNSSNSSKPSSTDIVKPKKTGPNIYNSRIKTGKKVGGQINHEGHSLSKNKVEEYIKNENIEVVKINHEINGNPNNSPIIKYKLGFKFIPVIEQHTFKFSKTSNEKLDKTFYSDVTYTDEFKSLVVFMNVHNVMSLNRITEFFKVLSKGVINLSEGTIINFMREFSNKSTASIDNITQDSDFLQYNF